MDFFFPRNYVVQHVLGLGDLKYSEKICSLLKGKFEELSLLRCGSHLVEKCLKSPGMAHYVVDDLLKISDHQFLHLARHKYGNFVIQQALRVTKVVCMWFFNYSFEDHILNAVFLISPTFHFTEWKHFPSQISSWETSKWWCSQGRIWKACLQFDRYRDFRWLSVT